MKMPMTLLLLHVERKLPEPLPTFQIAQCPQGQPSGK